MGDIIGHNNFWYAFSGEYVAEVDSDGIGCD